MIRAGKIVSHRLAGIRSEEDGSGGMYFGGERFRRFHQQLEMFRRHRIDSFGNLVPVGANNDGAIILQRLPNDFLPAQILDETSNAAFNG